MGKCHHSWLLLFLLTSSYFWLIHDYLMALPDVYLYLSLISCFTSLRKRILLS
jgi:hypothetical protein